MVSIIKWELRMKLSLLLIHGKYPTFLYRTVGVGYCEKKRKTAILAILSHNQSANDC